MAQGQRTHPAVLRRIEQLADEGLHPAQIELQLHDDAAAEPDADKSIKLADRIPARRTIQNVVRAHAPRDPSGPWRLGASEVQGEAAAVLTVLAAVIERTKGRTKSITKREAEWVTRLLAAAPDIPAFDCYRLARRYMLFQDRGLDSEPLDLALALAPWRDDGDRYRSALASSSDEIVIWEAGHATALTWAMTWWGGPEDDPETSAASQSERTLPGAELPGGAAS